MWVGFVPFRTTTHSMSSSQLESGFGASSLSREFRISATGTNTLDVLVLTPWTIVGVAIAALFSSIIVGLAVDSAVRNFASSSRNEIPEPREDMSQNSSGGTEIFNRFQQRTSSDRNFFLNSESGAWSMKGLSATNGASSIGFPIYDDIEDGCVALSPRVFLSLPQKDISDAVAPRQPL